MSYVMIMLGLSDDDLSDGGLSDDDLSDGGLSDDDLSDGGLSDGVVIRSEQIDGHMPVRSVK